MFSLWNLAGVEDGSLWSGTLIPVLAFHNIMKRQLAAHLGIQGFLHWTETPAEEKDKIIRAGRAQNSAARDDDGIVIEQMELKFQWEHLARNYHCKP